MNVNEFAKAMTPNISKFVPKDHRPTPKQMVFMSLTVREAGYGGATGGGKSDALLMDALQGVHIPGYAALLLRRTYSDLSLPGALMDRAHDWLSGSGARWVDKSKTWIFPTASREPATLTFGFMETDKDRTRYQGSELQYVGYDEATQFTERQYLYLFSRIRYTQKLKQAIDAGGINLPLKMRSATNPGGEGHVWYKQRFISAKKNRCLQHPTYAGYGEPPEGCKSCDEYKSAVNRIFVPSGLVDNPHIDQASYLEMLKDLDAVTRKQYIEGNWDVTDGGGMFSRAWFESNEDGKPHIVTLKYALQRNFVSVVRFWDMAGTAVSTINSDPDWTAGVLMGVTDEGEIWVLDVVRKRDNPGKIAEFIKETAQRDSKNWGELLMIRCEQEPGSSGKFVRDDFTKDHLIGYDIRFVKSTGQKHLRAKPFAAACYNSHVYMVRGPWNAEFLDEIEMFSPDSKAHDDQVDSASGAFRCISKHHDMSVSNYDSFKSQQKHVTHHDESLDDDPLVKLHNSPEYQASVARGRQFNWDGGV